MAARVGTDKRMASPVAMGRYTTMGLNWLYTHSKMVVVFVVFVFAMPMYMPLPKSRMAAGFLISVDVAPEPVDDRPAEKFKLVKLDRH
jgi:hypothetical protein